MGMYSGERKIERRDKIMEKTIYVTTDDLFEAAREINPECPIEWRASDGTKIILRAYDEEMDDE